jgi:uncharacterized surface anchored protein
MISSIVQKSNTSLQDCKKEKALISKALFGVFYIIKLFLTKIYLPIFAISNAKKRKNNTKKMMANHLKIKSNNLCASYNKELRYE